MIPTTEYFYLKVPNAGEWIYIGDMNRFAFFTTDASGGFTVQQAKDSSGTDAKDISGATYTGAGGALIEVDAQKMDINNGYAYVKATGAALFIGLNPIQKKDPSNLTVVRVVV